MVDDNQEMADGQLQEERQKEILVHRKMKYRRFSKFISRIFFPTNFRAFSYFKIYQYIPLHQGGRDTN